MTWFAITKHGRKKRKENVPDSAKVRSKTNKIARNEGRKHESKKPGTKLARISDTKSTHLLHVRHSSTYSCHTSSLNGQCTRTTPLPLTASPAQFTALQREEGCTVSVAESSIGTRGSVRRCVMTSVLRNVEDVYISLENSLSMISAFTISHY
ncbi:hypothetical protein BDQ17DRAFT_775505 [Cyathus striatus]|nr:hypothetical protein BDQ17DRAFT_775505 [Cyathus striatus]